MQQQKGKQEKPTNISPFPGMEEEVLKFWDSSKIFEKSVEREAPKGDYVFYDGPPFATGTPHYGHIVASVMKDVVPRYWTMNGYKVERKWGWDCHGLPIENIVEKEMGTKSKKEIQDMGVAVFNEKCRSKVLGYVDDWEKVVRRLGRWADMKNAYKTMDLPYMESIWWVFKELWDKGLIYEGYRSMHICPRCETTLSQQEVSEGYKDIKDLSAISKFELVDDPDTFVLAWTTTPWTLIGNVALAVGADINYVKIQNGDSKIYILAKERLEVIQGEYKILEEMKGANLIGKKYRPLFDYYFNDKNLPNRDNGWKIYHGNFVTTTDGTGVVHIAPAFGEDDMNLGKEYVLPFIQHVNMDGNIRPEAGEFAGMNVKAKDDHQKTDIEIIKYLAHKGLLFAKEKYEHSYPHCWRCDTPLINYATTSWFVNVLKVKEKALSFAENINWSPAHIKEGRFGNWLAGARDWSISRQRFWASVMPIWKCSCGEMKVFGSVAELEKASGQKVTDLHKHIVDEITCKCEKCGGVMKRIPDVLDTWFDSGSMPYAQMHYPFENKEKFDANFPAEFIAEGIDQTRAWFYYLHVIGTAIKDRPAFKNVIVNGIVLAEDGKKMSKRLQNYPDPALMFDKYGADAMRFYLLSSSVVSAENLNFAEGGVQEVLRNNVMTLWNVFKFYELFKENNQTPITSQPTGQAGNQSKNILDQWILARLNQLIEEITKQMNAYDLPRSVRPITDFINDLSTWYLRRSRDRFKSDNEDDKASALATTAHVLIELSKLMAPFMPFLAEQLWQKVTGNDFKDENKSVHLEKWPSFAKAPEGKPDMLIDDMANARSLVEKILAMRDTLGIKVRQPLQSIFVISNDTEWIPDEQIQKTILDEVNIKEWKNFGFEKELRNAYITKAATNKEEGGITKIYIDFEITPELKLEGIQREIVRFVNAMRKDAGLSIGDKAEMFYDTDNEESLVKDAFAKFAADIMNDTLCESITAGVESAEFKREVKIEGEAVKLGISKK